MNWKDCPHLFANGNFSFTTSKLDQFWQEEGYFYDMDGIQFSEKGYQPDSVVIGFKDCKLIARPISDMTDEEIEGYFNAYKKDYWKEMESFGWRHDSVREGLSINGMSSNQFVYLLSIGVYPFDDDTDVIYK